MFKKYKWNFVAVVLLVSVIGFIVIDLTIYVTIRQYLFQQTFKEMKMKTQLAVKVLEQEDLNSLLQNFTSLYNITYEIRKIVKSRVTIIDSTGHVLTDSDVSKETVLQMDNHFFRSEVQDAISFGWGQSYRRSSTINRSLFYTAYPILYNNKKVGFMRLAYYAGDFDESMKQLIPLIILSNIIGLVILLGVAWYSGSIVTLPILKIVSIAQKISEGNFERTFPAHRKDEIGSLASMLNQLTERLKTQIQQISTERSKLQNMLAYLDIGIIVIDNKKNIVNTNTEVFRIIGMELFDAKNKHIHELFDNETLDNSINQTLQDGNKTSGEFTFHTATGKKFLKYIITPFFIAEEKSSGTFIQIHDNTELKTLEAIRRDFVVNASHELKTPLTAIVGFAETLLEGAADEPSARIKFIRKIREQSQRLEILITDLLKLSELEREQPLELRPYPLNLLLHEIMDEFREKSNQKNIVLSLETLEHVNVNIDEEGIRTVFSNLVDNAIKYTPEQGTITIRILESENNRVKIYVLDTGIGIDLKYHERIFQRFYRVDKARSRAMGGTGLGLSIVKHILEKHNSNIFVISELGRGSCFCFELEKV